MKAGALAEMVLRDEAPGAGAAGETGRAVIRAGATVDRAIVDDGAVIGARAVVGRRNAPDCDIAVIGAGVRVVDDEAVEPGAMMYPD